MQYGLIGEHLGHSYSCEIHAQLADYQYELKELKPEELSGFLTGRDFKAINVTIPYKQAVIPYLDHISEKAAQIGAVNTIVRRDGKLYGYNTDFAGMAALIGKLKLDLSGKKVLILGTGGTSKTARAVAESLGAKEILKVSRRKGTGTVTYEEAATEHGDAQILINTTPCGMYPYTEACPVDLDDYPHLEGVIDAVYNPLRTKLVSGAIARGIPAEGGLYMLSAQAVYACGFFLNKEMSAEDIDRAFSHVLSQKQNIILTGMPSCGKSTVGAEIARRTGRRLVDTDDEVIARIHMPIADYFAAKGEEAFRDRESEAVESGAKESAQVIATGGGAVLRPENVQKLKANGRIFFIDRPLEQLITTQDRPLSSDREALERRYRERYQIYRKTADVCIDGSGTVEEVAEAILKAAGQRV